MQEQPERRPGDVDTELGQVLREADATRVVAYRSPGCSLITVKKDCPCARDDPSVSRADLASIVPVPRRSAHVYRDPLELVWVSALERMGVGVTRTEAAYADYDGKGVLAIGAPAILDPDDSLAQMIFHEICHWLVEGADSFALENWGLSNESLVHLGRENASLRVQAALADRYGLRAFLANTTDHRAYYDALPPDPLAWDDDGTVGLAHDALARAETPPWAPALGDALAATAAIVAATRPFASARSLYSRFDGAPRRI